MKKQGLFLFFISFSICNTPSFATESSTFNWHLGGRLHVDAAKYFDDDPASLGSGIEARRARLYIEGTIMDVWDFKFQYDFAFGVGNKKALNGIRDAFISYKGFSPISINLGHIKEPFSLQQMYSSNYITFMERSLIGTFARGRNLGIAVNSSGEAWAASLGLFGGGPDDPLDDGYGVTGRLSISPVHENQRALHLGLAGSWRSTDNEDTLRFSRRPESHVTDIKLVDTGSFNADDNFLFGLEVVAVKDAFSIQGEYIISNANGDNDVSFDGYYIQASLFLTGESRPYNVKRGNFKSIKPNKPISSGGFGAWQIALRFSHVDLTDENIIGGEQQNLTFGLNWYLSSKIRFMANYVKVLDVNGNSHDGVNPNIFQGRAQIYW